MEIVRTRRTRADGAILLGLVAAALVVGCGGDDASDEDTPVESSASDQGPCLMEIAGGRVEIELESSGLSCGDAKAIYHDYTVWLAREYTTGESSTTTIGEWECYSSDSFSPTKPLAGCRNGSQEFVVLPKPPPSSTKE